MQLLVLIWFVIQFSFNSLLFGFLFKLCYNLLLISSIKSCAILRFCRIWRNYAVVFGFLKNVEVLLDLSCNLFAKVYADSSSVIFKSLYLWNELIQPGFCAVGAHLTGIHNAYWGFLLQALWAYLRWLLMHFIFYILVFHLILLFNVFDWSCFFCSLHAI